MNSKTQVSLPQQFSMEENQFSFSESMKHLIVLPANPTDLSDVPGQLFSLNDGIMLSFLEQDGTSFLKISAIPASFPGEEVVYEYVSLGGQYYGGVIDKVHKVVRIGGLGVVDLLDTDPIFGSWHSMPFHGPGILQDPTSGNPVEIQASAVTLQRIQITTRTLTFSDSKYDQLSDYSGMPAVNPDTLAMGLVFTQDSGS